jgi:hypothetical protein
MRRWYGPELTFGSELSKRRGEFAILKYARNGSPLVTQWAPDGDALLGSYSFVDSQLGVLRATGYQPRVAGMIWVQGTGDASSLGVAESYADNLESLVDGIRDRYESPQMQFLFSQAHHGMDRPFVEALRARQREYASRDAHSVLIDIDDLVLKSDSVHYTSETQQELGFRFANAVIPEPYSAAFLSFLALVVALRGSRKRKSLIEAQRIAFFFLRILQETIHLVSRLGMTHSRLFSISDRAAAPQGLRVRSSTRFLGGGF